MSGQFGTGCVVSMPHFGTSAELSADRPLFDRAGSVRIFQIWFDSVQFINLKYPVWLFRFLHITAMNVHAVGKTSKGSEAVEAFTPSTSSMHNQQLLLT